MPTIRSVKRLWVTSYPRMFKYTRSVSSFILFESETNAFYCWENNRIRTKLTLPEIETRIRLGIMYEDLLHLRPPR